MSSGAPDIPTRANMSNSGEDQPVVYQNRPQSLSSIARLVRSDDDPELVIADGDRVIGAAGEDEPHAYQNSPKSISSMAQDRIVRSDVTGDRGDHTVEGAPGFEAVGAPKNPSLIEESGAS
nr:hypothetical protein [Tanacetum cinerariifolium]